MESLSAGAIFAKLRADKSNATCCDGGDGVASWASVSHGIFLSIGAAGVHRSLGVHLSFVQSLELDAWKPVHLRMMELGGNERFRRFLQQQGVAEDMPIREKYATRAASWYRRALRAEAGGQPSPPLLAPGAGALRCEESACAAGSALDMVFVKQPQCPRAPETNWMCRTLCAGFKVVLGAPSAPGGLVKARQSGTCVDDSDDDSLSVSSGDCGSTSSTETVVVGKNIDMLQSCSASFSSCGLQSLAKPRPQLTATA